MKNMMKKMISLAAILCLMTASLAGCGSKTVTEATRTDAPSQQEIQQENGQNPRQGDGAMEAPEMVSAQIPEEDVQTLIQAGLDAASGVNAVSCGSVWLQLPGLHRCPAAFYRKAVRVLLSSGSR